METHGAHIKRKIDKLNKNWDDQGSLKFKKPYRKFLSLKAQAPDELSKLDENEFRNYFNTFKVGLGEDLVNEFFQKHSKEIKQKEIDNNALINQHQKDLAGRKAYLELGVKMGTPMVKDIPEVKADSSAPPPTSTPPTKPPATAPPPTSAPPAASLFHMLNLLQL
jgi:hypothetical protein